MDKLVKLGEDFYMAAESNMLRRWAELCSEFDQIKPVPKGELADAIINLRKSFWHDGKDEDIEKYRKSIKELGNALNIKKHK